METNWRNDSIDMVKTNEIFRPSEEFSVVFRIAHESPGQLVAHIKNMSGHLIEFSFDDAKNRTVRRRRERYGVMPNDARQVMVKDCRYMRYHWRHHHPAT